MERISESGNAHTSYYWNLAGPTGDGCPNWIARWFLYHKFRYRDGRNRNLPSKDDSGRGSCHHSVSGGSSNGNQYYDTQTYGSMTSGGWFFSTSSMLSQLPTLGKMKNQEIKPRVYHQWYLTRTFTPPPRCRYLNCTRF
jgi:hypothetical protein